MAFNFLLVSRTFAVVAALLLFVENALANADVPIALQGAILAKALNYDQTLKEKRNPKVVILAGDAHAKDAEVLVKAFKALGGSVVVSSPGALGSDMRGASALYAFPGLLNDKARSLCLEHRVISMSGQKNDALSGSVSISLGVEDSRPQIIVHLPRSKAEGHKLSSRLLKLAKVVR